MNRTVVRLGAATLASAVLLTPVAASAHITVSSPDAAREGFGKVVVRVPNESDTASTTKVRLTLPADQPLAYVSVQPKTGWTVDVEKAKLDSPVMAGDARISEAVRTVTWSAEGGDGIKPGEFDEFALSGGPLPDAKDMTFDAQQTYSDGEVVDWNQVQKGDTEPEHPAPVLSLAAAITDDGDSTSATAQQTSASSDEGPDVLGRVLGIVAVVLAAAALLVSLRRSRA